MDALNFDYIEKRIENAKENNYSELELNNIFGLNKIPCDVFNLINLTCLYLNCNQLNVLPSEIGKLTNLIVLELNYNKLNTLPSEIGNLTNLECLDLIGNNLISLPEELFQLKKLKQCNIQRNLFMPNSIWKYKKHLETKKILDTLSLEIQDLKKQIIYMPLGTGYLEAKKDFEKLTDGEK